MDIICPKECILAVNISAIPITRVTGMTKRTEQVIGAHFMNPVPLKPMVEVIRAYHTSEETIERTTELLKQMGKEGGH